MRRNIFLFGFAFVFIAAIVTLVRLDLLWKYQEPYIIVDNCYTNGTKRDDRAFATIITPDGEDWALALAQNFVDKKSKYQLLILVVNMNGSTTISEEFNRKAKLLNAKPVLLEKAPMAPTVKPRFEMWSVAWNKLSAWKQLTNYSKIALLDVDMMLLKNADELLDMPDISFGMTSCVPCEEPYSLNGGLLVFEPSIVTYHKLMKLSQEPSPDNWKESEQQLIKEFCTVREPERAHVLSRIYNTNVNSCHCMEKTAWPYVKILHWMCDGTTGKPWHWTREKIETDLKTIANTDPTKKCVHEFNLQWHNNYERAMANTASVKA